MSDLLCRRSLVSSIVALPALAVPAVAQVNNPDAKLIALGERLKVLMPRVAALGLKSHTLNKEACAGFPNGWGMDDKLNRTFKERGAKNGYYQAYDEWNEACSELSDLTQAILDIPSTDPIGDGIRAAAALAIDHDFENAYNMEDLLWELAARAGFTRPEKVYDADAEEEDAEEDDEAASHAQPPLDELVQS
jgi:hypothetical protein